MSSLPTKGAGSGSAVCEWLYVEEGAVVGRDGPSLQDAARQRRAKSRCPRASAPLLLPGEGLYCPSPLQHLQPFMWNLRLSLQQMWGTAWGEHPCSSLMDPHGAGGVWGSLGIGVPCPLSSRVLGVAGCWERMSQLLGAGPDWWNPGGMLGVSKGREISWRHSLVPRPQGSSGSWIFAGKGKA